MILFLCLFCRRYMVVMALLLAVRPAAAFPPVPNGVIYGLVKDQLGTPLLNAADTVVLQTPAGVQVSAAIQPNLALGVNYALQVPMDAGNFAPPYLANALTTGATYKLYVVVNGGTNLPIEMTGAYATLGLSGTQTRHDLTLGTDANGDGIPDAWESAFLQSSGLTNTLASLTAGQIFDGRTLKQQYLLGNYPFNPGTNFNVQLVSQSGGVATLAFTTMTGRTYTAYGSTDLQNWTTLNFSIPASGSATMHYYYSPNIASLQIQTVQPANAPVMQFFRLELQ